MTESGVENLLQQMALREPSSELDQRVLSRLESISYVEATPMYGGSTKFTWLVACCAFVLGGAAFGYGVFVVQESERRAEMRTMTAMIAELKRDRPDTMIMTGNDLDRPNNSSAPNPNLVVIDGPPVALLCSASSQTAPGDEVKRCTNCHSGATNADGFDHRQVHSFHRQLCARCHSMSGALEHWQLPEIDEAIGKDPWHGADKTSSPTG